MKSKAPRFLVSALLIAAALIVSFNAWFAFRSLNVLLAGEDWVQHTWQVINTVEMIISSAKDAETGTRGFLITGDDQYLAPYASALAELPREMRSFQSLTVDNPTQQEHAVTMQAVLDERLGLLQQGINLHRNGRADSLHAMIVTGTGKAQMDRLRNLADEMEREEQRLLVVRVADTRTNSRRTRVTIGVASLIDFCLIVLMFRYFAHERDQRLASDELAERLAVARAETEAKAEELLILNKTLEERVQLRTAELETTNRELEAFSYSVSHDLRAPLRTIDGFSLALEEDYAAAIDVVGKDYIRRVRSGVQRMGELIDALLQLSRITRAAIVREPFDLSALATTIAEELGEQNQGRELRFDIQQGLLADADPKLSRVALENLLGNAVKFSAKVSEAVVEFGWDAEREAWFVRDNGAGFDMYYKDKLFNAFNRLHGDKDFKGSGIGLATVARVIRRHHGRIWADSVVGHGATFWFTLG
jgi:signal transduction histidine kinase